MKCGATRTQPPTQARAAGMRVTDDEFGIQGKQFELLVL